MKSSSKMTLLPQPQRITYRSGTFVLDRELSIVCQGDAAALRSVAERIRQSVLETQSIRATILAAIPQGQSSGHGIIIRIEKTKPVREQGYRLSITRDGVQLVGQDAAGAFYGAATLVQMLRQNSGALPACEIEDFPDFASRGIMVDISRDKVPTLETLFTLVDEMTSWKLNHLELYTEHTFAFANHREVWAQASPMTAQDILALDAYCRERYVELAPNFNSFGHFHRWLELPRYRDMSECPDGFDHPWGPGGRFNHPFSLNPNDPRSLELLGELYAEMLPCFTSRRFNVGCDETIDLGLGKSKAVCERKGKGRVYLEFIHKINKMVKRHGRTMHFWGDIIIQHPELVKELPKDIVVLEWGYEATHPFEQHGEKFAKTGIPFFVCPGTSSWCSLSGRTDNCLGNLRSAAANGVKYGAKGFLNTDWGDNGHWQYLPISFLGYAAGAALSWSYASNRESNFIDALDTHVFRDSAGVMGKLAYDLGNAYLRAGHLEGNASPLARILMSPENPLPEGVTEKTLTATKAYVEKVMSSLSQARMNRADGPLIQEEFTNIARMLNHACNRGIAIRRGKLQDTATRMSLGTDMRIILGVHRDLWMARNRVGGLQDSAKRLDKLVAEYDGK